MANNYTQFSFELTTPEGKEEEALKFNVYLTARVDAANDTYELWEKYGGVEIDVEDDGLWIHADESGNVEAAINITQEWLNALDMPIDYGVYFGWASWCSKPRLNEFSGGGVVVIKDDIIISGSYDSCRAAEERKITVHD